MRSLLISILSLAILIGGWFFFDHYSDDNLRQMIGSCDTAVMPAVEAENWKEADENFTKIYDQWKNYRKNAFYFLDTSLINETDFTFAKTLKYIKAEDVSNGSGELLSLREQLESLHLNEKVSLQNIL